MSEMPSLTQQRHRDNLTKCVSCLKNYINSTDSNDQDYALMSEELRKASRWIGIITGHVTTEEILDVIFRDFCIGK
jgi:tRNA modification GTPase